MKHIQEGLVIQASSATEMLKQLGALDVSVPPRSQGRKSDDCERWSICRFLAAIAKSSTLKYPLRLTKREAPDFSLELPSGKIGIEVTEAVPPDQAEIGCRREKLERQEAGSGFVWAHRFEPGSSKNKREKEMIARGRPSDGWAGNDAEQNWVNWMLHAYNTKMKKKYSGASSYWLLVYDNIFVPNLNFPRANEYLKQGLLSEPGSLQSFERVCIESRGLIWNFHDSAVSTFKIPPLWENAI